MVAAALQASEVMAPEPVAEVLLDPSVGEVVELLQSTSHSVFPVLRVGSVAEGSGERLKEQQGPKEAGSTGHLAGVVYRWQLLSLLRRPELLRQLLLCQQARAAPADSADQKLAGGKEEAEEQESEQKVVVALPTSAAQLIPRDLRLALLSLLAQSPAEVPPTEEAGILAPYTSDAAGQRGSTASASSQISSLKGCFGHQPHGSHSSQEKQVHATPAPAAANCSTPNEAVADHPPPPSLHDLVQQRLDLAPLLLQPPVSVTQGASLEEVLLLLHRLGLHSLVVQEEPRLVGMITRQDLDRRKED